MLVLFSWFVWAASSGVAMDFLKVNEKEKFLTIYVDNITVKQEHINHIILVKVLVPTFCTNGLASGLQLLVPVYVVEVEGLVPKARCSIDAFL